MSEPAWVPLGGAVGGDVVYEGAWSNTVTYQPGDVVTYQGVQFLAVQPSTGQTPPVAVAGIPYSEKGAPSGVAPLDASGYLPWAQAPRSYYSATPPASPQDGDEWVFPADAGNGVLWRFRYRAGSASIYKWEFVGGSDLVVGCGGVLNTAGTWLDLPTPGLISLSRAGVYVAQTGGMVIHTAAAQAYLGPAAGATTPAAYGGGWVPVANAYAGMGGAAIALTVAAGGDIRARGFVGAAGMNFATAWLLVKPVRVS